MKNRIKCILIKYVKLNTAGLINYASGLNKATNELYKLINKNGKKEKQK